MKSLIITGGNINKEFLHDFLKENKFEKIIASYKGLEILNKLNVKQDFIIGDFDSVNKEILEKYYKKKKHGKKTRRVLVVFFVSEWNLEFN